MRTPTSWQDKGLLEDEPFAAAFLAQKYGQPARGRRSINWMQDLAHNIKRTPQHLTAAKQWIAYAFAPEGLLQGSGNVDASAVPVSVDLLEVFVCFYYALYVGDEYAAQKVVNDERKKRGFYYRLPNMWQALGNMDGVAAAVSQHKRAAAAPTAVPVAPLGTENEHSGAGNRLSAPGASNVTTTRKSGGAPRPVTARVTEEAALQGSLDFNVTMSTSREYSPMSELTELSDEEPEDVSTTAEPSTALPSGTPGGSTSPTAIPVDADAPITKASIKTNARPDKRKNTPAEIPARSLRQRHPRGATNTGRISELARADFDYHEQLKRVHPDDVPLDYVDAPEEASVQIAGSQKQHTRKKSKKSKTQSPARAEASVSAPPTTHLTAVEPQESASSAPVRHPPMVEDADVPSQRQSRGATSKRNTKAKASSVRKKLKTSDNQERPSKRQRGAADELNAFGVLNQAMLRQCRPNLQVEPGDSPKPASAPAGVSMDKGAKSDGRKRARLHAVDVAPEGGEQLLAERQVVNLPRRKSNRLRLSELAPRVPPAALGIPATLQEEDQIVRDIALEALLQLRNQSTVAEEWAEDAGVQDDPPTSDDEEEVPLNVALASSRRVQKTQDDMLSSDEEEIPLSALIAARRKPQDAVVPVVSQRAQPAEYRTPTPGHPFASCSTLPTDALPFASCSTLSSAVVPPTGSRPVVQVPKPAPPPMPPKQPLTNQPIIWAESRQEVCESFDWFRSYQGGVYFNNDMVKGYLLSAFSSGRDLFARDGRLIISHGGGKAESVHTKAGQHTVHEAADQHEEDKSVRALLRTYQMKRPLVLIIDDRYALFPYDLATKGYTYVVLGFYHIAHAWAERHPAHNGKGYVIRYKFAFEWCKKQPEPWWLKGPDGLVPPDTARHPAATYICPSCEKASPLLYEGAWMCLQANCASFWTRLNGTRPPEDLTYDSRFVNSSFQCDHGTLEDIAPLPPATGAADGVITSRRFCKGWHCKKCGRLSSRYKWEHWECKSCGNTLQVSGKHRSYKEFWGQTNTDKFMHHKVSPDSGIIVTNLTPYRAGNGKSHYHMYILPENRGRIYLILANHATNDTANVIFQEYQEQAHSGELRFRRWPLRQHQCRGTLLTNYFSQNTGEPYQYVGGTDNTVPFAGAPSAVVKARDLIHSRMLSVMQAESSQYCFNEVLSAAYMEKQKMAFHSDAERGLGPRVASLSLGSSAYMHFRVLKKYREDKSSGANQNVLTLFLRHGDILIMDGAAIQEYYEHTVVPLNFRIAATARFIGAQ